MNRFAVEMKSIKLHTWFCEQRLLEIDSQEVLFSKERINWSYDLN